MVDLWLPLLPEESCRETYETYEAVWQLGQSSTPSSKDRKYADAELLFAAYLASDAVLARLSRRRLVDFSLCSPCVWLLPALPQLSAVACATTSRQLSDLPETRWRTDVLGGIAETH